jgi:peptidoglycan hydrolase-like protein with peptidoglycan-binding domain
MSQRRVPLTAAIVACVPAIMLGAASCTTSQQVTADTPSVTTPGATTPPATALATPPSTTTPPTTAAPTTAAPTTAPPTTTPPPEIPSNVEIVGPAFAPLEGVGTRSGPATAAVQERLLQLGFWHTGSDGEYGDTTRQAVMAFQKYIGLPATGKTDDTTAAYLSQFGERAHGQANTGTLVEVDKAKQVLFIVVEGKTVWALNTSTGNGEEYEEPDKNTPGEVIKGVSLTPDGLWEVNRERPEGWWEGDLGKIYRPKYFVGGVALHGSSSVPNYPASHGCVRLSTSAMDFIWDSGLVPKGTTVWVHG